MERDAADTDPRSLPTKELVEFVKGALQPLRVSEIIDALKIYMTHTGLNETKPTQLIDPHNSSSTKQ